MGRAVVEARPGSGDLDDAVARALEQLEYGGEAALAAFCAAQGPLRAVILQRVAALQDLGLAPRALPMPTELGPYRVLEKLGEGGFGEVFLARQEQPIQRLVAVKLLRSRADAGAMLRRFAVERELLARFDHPAIAKVLDAGVAADGRPYLVVEYVAGEPLLAFCERHALDVDARLRLFVQVCDGVQHAHQRGVVHRDLKPSNVLVAMTDGVARPKIIDFGVARAVDTGRAEAGLTRAGTMLGTPEYMSPEQADGAADVDTRTDVYSLGVMLYELLVGDLPQTRARWRSASVGEQWALIHADAVPRPSARVPPALARRLRGDLEWIVLAAMAKDRDRRYRTVAALADDIDRHLRHEPVTAGPPSALYLTRKFVRRHRVPVAAAAAVLLSLLAGLAVSLSLFRQSERNAALAQRRLGQFLGLSDVVRLRELLEALPSLSPSVPERIPALRAWLDSMRGLAARAAARPAVAEATSADANGDDRPAERFLRETLLKLNADLAQAFAPDGPVARVERRLAFAETVVARTLEAPAAAWEAVRTAVASSPLYGGLTLTPQLGLVPIGPDPDSGLQEFAHLESGEVPRRGADGRLHPDEAMAIVLVLVPGGVARAWVDDHYADVSLAPFLVSKFEVTRAQWLRLSGQRAEFVENGAETGGGPMTDLHPAENLIWRDVQTELLAAGLELPTDVQWEHACRAGSTTAWFTGAEPASLQGFANIAGAEVGELGRRLPVTPEVRDRYLISAPVGTFAPNRFGLHDTHGNLVEACRDAMAADPPRDGDGYRAGGDLRAMIVRGGSYKDSAAEARCSARQTVAQDAKSILMGVRPVRALR